MKDRERKEKGVSIGQSLVSTNGAARSDDRRKYCVGDVECLPVSSLYPLGAPRWIHIMIRGAFVCCVVANTNNNRKAAAYPTGKTDAIDHIQRSQPQGYHITGFFSRSPYDRPLELYQCSEASTETNGGVGSNKKNKAKLGTNGFG